MSTDDDPLWDSIACSCWHGIPCQQHPKKEEPDMTQKKTEEKKTWAACECGSEMVPNGACTLTHIKTPEGKYIPRIPNGNEQRFGGDSAAVCHDCNAAIGSIHHINCDWEECPVCGGQAWGCEHIEAFVELEEK